MGLGILRGFSVETGGFVEGEMGIKEKQGHEKGKGKERFWVVEELVGQDIYKYKENSKVERGKNKKDLGVLSWRRSEMGPIWCSRCWGLEWFTGDFAGPFLFFNSLPVLYHGGFEKVLCLQEKKKTEMDREMREMIFQDAWMGQWMRLGSRPAVILSEKQSHNYLSDIFFTYFH